MLTDVHCHILPGIDDGARSIEQSVAMARIAVEDGIGTTVVTPHHLNGVYTNRAGQIHGEIERLQCALRQAGIELELLPGSELHLTPELPEALDRGSAMTVGNHNKAALVELPVHTIPVGTEHLLEQIIAQGLEPVIAHPERNSELRRTPERLAEWVEMGCLGQVTVNSCTGKFGEAVRKAAETMIKAGSIHIAASDAHRDRRRVPQLTPARDPIVRWTNHDVATLLLEIYPRDLAAGRPLVRTDLQEALAASSKKSWLTRMLGFR